MAEKPKIRICDFCFNRWDLNPTNLPEDFNEEYKELFFTSGSLFFKPLEPIENFIKRLKKLNDITVFFEGELPKCVKEQVEEYPELKKRVERRLIPMEFSYYLIEDLIKMEKDIPYDTLQTLYFGDSSFCFSIKNFRFCLGVDLIAVPIDISIPKERVIQIFKEHYKGYCSFESYIDRENEKLLELLNLKGNSVFETFKSYGDVLSIEYCPKIGWILRLYWD
jgi:hypothetical protein